MKNSAYLGESDSRDVEMNQQRDIGFQPPPPYSIEQPSITNFEPNSIFGLNVPNPTLNLFDQTLGNSETFILAPMGRFGFATRTIVVQLQNTAQQPLMSIMTVPGQNINTGAVGVDHHNTIRIGSVIRMTNTSGQVLLTARESGQSITISSGEHVLGMVEGNLLCNTSLTARGVMGEVLFQSIDGTEMNTSAPGVCCGSTSSEFTLISNGVALARIEKPNDNSAGCTITLLNSRNIDLRTKALLLFTGYLVYYSFLAETSFGNIGARGFAKRICMFVCLFFLVAMVLFISIPLIVLTTR